MKKLLIWVSAGLFLSFPFLGRAHALGEFGQNEQYYRVVFDGEEEASIYAKLTYVNLGKDAITEIPLEIPGSSIRILSVVQEKSETTKYCVQYDYTYRSPYPSPSERPCLKWGENVNGLKTYSLIQQDQTKDQKLDNSLKAVIKLNEKIDSTKSGTIILSYKTKGFTTTTWDGFKYSFETIKSQYDIDSVRVAIDVSDDLYLKDSAEGNTKFQDNFPALPTLETGSFKASQTAEIYSNMIANAPGVIKETSSLDPNESFVVSGKVYLSSWQGNLITYILIGLTFLLIIGVLIYIIQAERKK